MNHEMNEVPRHRSLEREFFAVVPPQAAPPLRRLRWWLLLHLIALPPVAAWLRRRVGR